LADSGVDYRDEDVYTQPQLSPKTCFGNEAVAEPRPLRALFVITGTGYCAALEAMDTAAAMPAVMRYFDAHGDMVDRATRAISILSGVMCYRLTLGTPDETSAAMAYAMMRIPHRP
jgi:hypothetical protein